MDRKIKCLLVDDDKDDFDFFQDAVNDTNNEHRNLSIELSWVNSAEKALHKLNGNGNFIPDYIFLDLNMPLRSGKECLTDLKSIPTLKTIPVIIYSTSSDPAEIRETKSMGANAFLIKPMSLSILSEALYDYFLTGKSYLFF